MAERAEQMRPLFNTSQTQHCPLAKGFLGNDFYSFINLVDKSFKSSTYMEL